MSPRATGPVIALAAGMVVALSMEAWASGAMRWRAPGTASFSSSRVAAHTDGLPVTVSVGLASHPQHGAARDELYRTGGEEFCAVLLDVDAEEGFAIAERLRRRVAAMREGLPVTVSVGLAGHPDHGALRDEVLTAADVALYHSKRTGKNRTTTAGAAIAPQRGPSDREVRLALLHEKDPETVVHSTHVTTLAVELGRELDLDEERMADLRTAAQLHDIGKVAVPDDVLRKHGPLAPDEERLLRVHPTVGASLLRAWGLTTAARFVEEHHERLDGTGYPHGLAGAQIALESRIIAVADAHVRGSQPVGDPVVDAALRAVTRPPVAHAA